MNRKGTNKEVSPAVCLSLARLWLGSPSAQTIELALAGPHCSHAARNDDAQPTAKSRSTMKIKLLFALIAGALLLGSPSFVIAAEPSEAAKELKELVTTIRTKLVANI